MLVAPWAKSVGEPEEVGLVDRCEHRHHSLLDDLILQRRDAQRTLFPVRLGDVHAPRWQRAVAACLHRPP